MTEPSVAIIEKRPFRCQKMMFGRIKKLYFVGIGGAGMSGIAEILKTLGYEVNGSDAVPSEVTRYLANLGIEIHPSHHAENIGDADVVVISSAVGESNPEVIAARERGIPVIKRAEMLGELMRLKFSIGIAGTHGKTTTTSMVGRIFQHARLNPTLIVGGVVKEMGTGATLGTGDYLITEVDEYDRSIEAMFPSIAVVLNLEADHLDCYADMDDLRHAFLGYLNRVPFFGTAIVSADDQNLKMIRDRITRPLVSFGFSPDADYRAVEITATTGGSSCSVFHKDELLGELRINLLGRHNVLNALAAAAVGTELKVPFETIADALSGFRGVERRFETVGEFSGVLVIDDYAHHPTEIQATLQAARQLGRKKIITIYQPHLFSRTQAFAEQFADVLSVSDHCVLTDIYPAREEPIPGVTSEMIMSLAFKNGFRNFSCVGKKENAIAVVAKMAQPGDIVIVMGAGSITHIRHELGEALEAL